MGFSELINNIASTVNDTLAGSTNIGPKYPSLQESLGLPDIDPAFKERWFNYRSQAYAFGVVGENDLLSLETSGQQAIGAITAVFGGGSGPTTETNGSSKFDDFVLPINPQEITQEEPFAVSITPTQGGTVVRHGGNRYKNLSISGTTGVHPFKGATGVNRLTGAALFQPDTLKYRSGYEVFLHFRNWIRSYHQTKAEQSSNLRMVFKNYKDWEFLIVEPEAFTMKRDAQKPLLYNYSIKFRVLGHYKAPTIGSNTWLDAIDDSLNKATASIEQARGLFNKFQEVIRATGGEINQVIENLRLVTLAVKAARGVPITMSDVGKRIDSNFLSQGDALKLMLKIGEKAGEAGNDPKTLETQNVDLETLPDDPNALATNLVNDVALPGQKDAKQKFIDAKATMGDAIKTLSIEDYPPAAQTQIYLEQQAAAQFTAQEIENIAESVQTLYNQYNDAVGGGDATFNRIFDLTSTVDSEITNENIDIETEVQFGFSKALDGLYSLLSNDQLFDTNRELYSRADSKSGAEKIGKGIFAFPEEEGAVREGVVPFGATLEDIAFYELGDSSRWTELAELNHLKSPYIASNEENTKINYTVESSGYNDTADLQGLVPTQYYLVAAIPAPINGWLGKENQIALYEGGDANQASSWRFFIPQTGMLVKVKDRQKTLKFDGSNWVDYTEPNDLTNVLKPGDIILLPSNTPGENFKNRGPRDNPVLDPLTEAEKALAVDLKLLPSGDLDLTPSGDLNVVAGPENGAQAIILKILYQTGDLKKFPAIGTHLRTGGKMPNIGVVRTQILNSLLQDPRIEDVRNINLRQEGSALYINFVVQFINIQQPATINIPI